MCGRLHSLPTKPKLDDRRIHMGTHNHHNSNNNSNNNNSNSNSNNNNNNNGYCTQHQRTALTSGRTFAPAHRAMALKSLLDSPATNPRDRPARLRVAAATATRLYRITLPLRNSGTGSSYL
jgi:hypothetical protein